MVYSHGRECRPKQREPPRAVDAGSHEVGALVFLDDGRRSHADNYNDVENKQKSFCQSLHNSYIINNVYCIRIALNRNAKLPIIVCSRQLFTIVFPPPHGFYLYVGIV